MRKVLLAMLRAVVVLPFTAGTPGGLFGSFRLYDCSTSSVVMLSGLLAMIVVFTGSLAIPENLISRLMTIIVIMIIILIVGIFVCFLIICIVYRHGTLSVPRARFPQIKSKNLHLLFLWLFAISASVFNCFNIVVQIECADSVTPIKIIQSILLMLFMILETVLINVLTSYSIKPLPLLRYAMRFLIAVDLSVWFNAVIRENTTVRLKPSKNNSCLISDYINCVNNSTSGKMYMKSWQFFSPALVEFFLLAVTMLAEIILLNFPKNGSNQLPSGKERRDYTIESIEEENECTAEEESENRTEEEGEENKEEEETPLLPTRTVSTPNHKYCAHSSVSITEGGLNGTGNTTSHNSILPCFRITVGTPIWLHFAIGLSVVLSLPIFAGYLLQATVFPNNLILTELLSWYEVAVKFLMLLAVLLGFYFIENITAAPKVSNSEMFKTKDWIFLMSVFCMFSCHSFEMLVGYVLKTQPANAIFVANCMSVAQDYFQTVLLLHVAKCQRNVPYAECMGFVSVCLFMTITNFGCWVVDGFIIAHSLEETRKETMKILAPTVWMSLYSIFLPLTLYYRFTSAFAFHELYKTFKPE